MEGLLERIGRRFKAGSIEFRTAAGRHWRLGRGPLQAVVRVRDAPVVARIAVNPGLEFGETYMEGGWEPEGQSLAEVLGVGLRMLASAPRSGLQLLSPVLGRIAELNTPGLARRHVQHHYDLEPELYRFFLDADLHYSCAYFAEAGMSLEAAQQAKCALIAAKLDLRPGATVLDVGCGWGSLALYLAREYGAKVTGITLSTQQLQQAQARAEAAGLSNRVQFQLADYRQVQGRYDAVVSVGMFEHVGRPQYRTYFQRVRERLQPGGVALIHTIGRSGTPARTSPWIAKYIFPGGYIPAASETLAAAEPSGLRLTDFEVWRLHYAQTLAEWHRRFMAHRPCFAARMGERFCRMWEFYLQGAEASFRWGDLVVFQLQFALALERLPLTRDYLYPAKAAARLDSAEAFP